jgi:hypothetical protein
LPMASHKLTGLSAGTTAGDSVEYGGSPTFTNVTAASVTTTGATGSLNSINTFGFKNRIINGAMVIDQRNAGASVTGSTTNPFSVDRWQTVSSQNSKFTAQQNAGSVTPPAGFINYLGITSSSAYSIVAADQFRIFQSIEGLNVADLAWGTVNAATVTLSFKVYSSLTGTFGGSLANNAYARSYPFTYTISTANTWTTISVTIAGDTSGTWQTNNGNGVIVSFGLGVGSTLSGTAGAWATASYTSAAGAVSVVGTSGATFYITGVQLEKGSVATSFDQRAYSQELAMCQRYLPAIRCTGSGAFEWFGAGVATSTTNVLGFLQFLVPPRVKPTGITIGNVGNYILMIASGAAQIATGVVIGAGSIQGLAVNFQISGGSATNGQGSMVGFRDTASTSEVILFTGCEL